MARGKTKSNDIVVKTISFTKSAPLCSAALATDAFLVSTETGTSNLCRSASNTGSAGWNFVRVHDVEANYRAIKMMEAIRDITG